MANPIEPTPTTFNFFGLPRELRDVIYEYGCMTSHHQALLRGAKDQKRMHIRVVLRKPLLNLLLINRQFATEYQERRHKLRKTTVIDDEAFMGSELLVPAKARDTVRLELRLVLFCSNRDQPLYSCRVTEDLEMHLRWIPSFTAQMTSLEDLHIKLYIFPHESTKRCLEEVLARLDSYTDLHKVSCVEVQLCDPATRVLRPHAVRLAIWRASQGLTVLYPKQQNYFGLLANVSAHEDEKFGLENLGEGHLEDE